MIEFLEFILKDKTHFIGTIVFLIVLTVCFCAVLFVILMIVETFTVNLVAAIKATKIKEIKVNDKTD